MFILKLNAKNLKPSRFNCCVRTLYTYITEELWALLGNDAGTISYAEYPKFNPDYLVESEFAYPVSVNGKMKINLPLALDLDAKAVEEIVLAKADVQLYLDGKPVKKLIFVKR